DLAKFYDRLLAVMRQPVTRNGQWRLLECLPAWYGNWTCDCFLAYAWEGIGDERLLVAVNYACNQSQCYVRLPFTDLANGQWRIQDQLSSFACYRDGNDLRSRGLYLDMTPRQAAIYSLQVHDR